MIYTNKIKTDLRSREILPGSFNDNLFTCIRCSLERYSNSTLPWHWHDSFEVDYIAQGELEVHGTDRVLKLKQGDVLFINHGEMHEYRGTGDVPCVFIAIMFDFHFLSGAYNSSIEQKYILPMKEYGPGFFAFSPDSPRRIEMAQAVNNAIELCRAGKNGYEMQLRSELSGFWLGLLEETGDLRRSEGLSVIDKERIKKMLAYIHTNYAGKVSMDELAASAGVSIRECTRCFSKCMGMPPVKYLNEYRVHKAAEMLLESDASVLDVSLECGFSSSSYFGKSFSTVMGCTPGEYRRGKGSAGAKTE